MAEGNNSSHGLPLGSVPIYMGEDGQSSGATTLPPPEVVVSSPAQGILVKATEVDKSLQTQGQSIIEEAAREGYDVNQAPFVLPVAPNWRMAFGASFCLREIGSRSFVTTETPSFVVPLEPPSQMTHSTGSSIDPPIHEAASVKSSQTHSEEPDEVDEEITYFKSKKSYDVSGV